MQKEKEAEEKGVDLCKVMMAELAEKGIEHIRTYTVARLKDLICYKFHSDVYKRNGIKKAGLVDEAMKMYRQSRVNNECDAVQENNENETNATLDTGASDVANVTLV